MYYSNTFEAAMIICGYHLYRLFYTDRARYIRKAEGFIRIRSKRVIDGKIKRVKRQIRVRWDAAGICFRASDNQRLPQYDLPLNLFIGNSRKVPLVDVVVWAKKRIFPKNRMDCKEILKLMGLPDYNAWEIVKRTNACLMEDPFWLRFSEDETFEDTTRGRARRIMAEYQKPANTN